VALLDPKLVEMLKKMGLRNNSGIEHRKYGMVLGRTFLNNSLGWAMPKKGRVEQQTQSSNTV